LGIEQEQWGMKNDQSIEDKGIAASMFKKSGNHQYIIKEAGTDTQEKKG